MSIMKVCTKCNKELSVFEFSKNKSHSDGRDSICKNCRKIQIQTWKLNNPDKCAKHTLSRAKRLGLHGLYAYQALANKRQSGKYVINLTVEELTDKAMSTEVCPICGTTIDYSLKKGKMLNNSPSLDRKDNGLTIDNDNSWVICQRCNRTKSDRTIEEFISFMEVALRRLRS